jgi:hypothetical protein
MKNIEPNSPQSWSDGRKRAYTRPEFRKYGSLAHITAAASNMSANADGGTMDSMNKTS